MSKYILILCGFLLLGCTSPYIDHMRREMTPLSLVSHLGQIEKLSFSTLPDVSSLATTIHDIQGAEKRIWIEIYTWTEKSLLTAILDAHARGVDVRVILEGNVYRTPRINDPFFDALKEANIPVYFADNTRYNFTHAKFWLIDDMFCVSTGNWSYSTFTKNRDFFTCGYDKNILENLEEIFLADTLQEKPLFPHGLDRRLGVSPINMRSYIEDALTQSEKSLYIYNQSLSDERIIALLEEKYKNGVDVRVCTTSVPGTGALEHVTFPLHNLEKPYLHAKLLLIDDAMMILGSMNFTTNAIDHNREIAISIEKNEKYFSQAKNLFLRECFPD